MMTWSRYDGDSKVSDLFCAASLSVQDTIVVSGVSYLVPAFYTNPHLHDRFLSLFGEQYHGLFGHVMRYFLKPSGNHCLPFRYVTTHIGAQSSLHSAHDRLSISAPTHIITMLSLSFSLCPCEIMFSLRTLHLIIISISISIITS